MFGVESAGMEEQIFMSWREEKWLRCGTVMRSSMFTSDPRLVLLAPSSSSWMITPVLIAPEWWSCTLSRRQLSA
jgi:hypothetical protein